MKKIHVGFLAAAAISALLSAYGTAQAGDILRLKSVGSIVISDCSQDILNHRIFGTDQENRHFVIQFSAHISESDKRTLVLQGIELERYLPEDALLVRSTAQAAALAKVTGNSIRAVTPFAPEWKISPEFFNEPTSLATQGLEQILLSTLADSSAESTARELARLPDVKIEWVRERDIMVRAPKSRLSEMAQIDAIEWIQRAPVIVSFVFPGEPDASSHGVHAKEVTGFESGTKLMNLDAAWNRGFEGEGQIAAVADTGLDSGDVSTIHPDFKETLLKGYLMGLGTETWGDSMGHGTHVCGSVVGTGRASDGAFRGGAHKGKLIIEGLWSAILDNLAPGSDLNHLFGAVYSDGARVHSNSWGNARNLGDYDTLAANVDEYMWNNPEMLILFAAGNSGVDDNADGRIDEGSVGSPGTAKNVLTVGASKNFLLSGGIQKQMHELHEGEKKWGAEPIRSSRLSDNAQGLAAFSSRGPTSDGRIKPEIVAPGTNIVSTRSHNPKSSKLWGEYNADYAYAGGTSMATPLTAGAATVLREYVIKSRGIATPSAALIKATLMHTATDLYPGQFGEGPKQELPTRRPNVHEGYGRVNMDLATALGNDTQLLDDKTGVGLGEDHALTLNIGASGFIRATMTYTDAPASATASKSLVNDIDLKITGPNGEVFQKQDRINNTEMLELSGLRAGPYTVTISGINVPQGKNGRQPYGKFQGRCRIYFQAA